MPKVLRPILFLLTGCICLSSHKESVGPEIRVDLEGIAQGTTWHITYYSQYEKITRERIDSLLVVLDSSLSIYKPYSRITAFNNDKTGITVDEHLRRVVEKSIETSIQSNGLFDITVLPLVEAWGFGVTGFHSVPDSAAIRELLACIGFQNLKLSMHELIKLKPCIKIDVNGIAQGYSVDVIADFLERNQIRNYLVELGGEIRVRGKKQDVNESFRIGIEAPSYDPIQLSGIQKIIVADSGAITTSGNYRKYYETEGRKISHLIDPRTGFPIQNELISVTVYASNAMHADAFDNVLMVMGLSGALEFVEKRKDLAAYFIYQKSDGSVADTASTAFYRLIKK